MNSRHFSRSVKRAAYARSNGRCENPSCGVALPAGWGGINYDHIINWAISRDSSLENCRVLCVACHLKKTAGYDIPVIAKVTRIADKRIDIKRASRKLPGSRNDPFKIRIGGGTKPRLGRGGEHRALMAKLQPGGVK